MEHGFSGSDQPAAEIYNRCIRCGLCLPTCPTYLETYTETSGPRGRIGLIKSVAEQRLDLLSPGFVEQMSQCLDCRACEAACPSGVQYGRLLETARAQIERAQAPQRAPRARALRWLLLEALFARPALMRATARLLQFAQFFGITALASRLGSQHLVALAPHISARFFTPRDRRFDARDPKGVAFLHAGCVMQVAFARVHEATVRLLVRGGLSVVVPSSQGCCGAIAIHAGLFESGRALAKQNILAFERSGADVYVVNAAGCTSALKEYATYFQGDPQWEGRARRFSQRVRDVTEVLDALDLDPPVGRVDATVTYQEPCHLAHAQRIHGAPRRLLEKIPGLRLVEMRESALCCGAAGIYALSQPEMSSRLRARKTQNILDCGAGIVATANPGCAMTVAAGLAERRSDVAVAHVVELLDRAYGAGETAVTRARSPSASGTL